MIPFFDHVPSGNCMHGRALSIDFGQDDPGADEETSGYPPSTEATITPAHLSDFDPWAGLSTPHGEK